MANPPRYDELYPDGSPSTKASEPLPQPSRPVEDRRPHFFASLAARFDRGVFRKAIAIIIFIIGCNSLVAGYLLFNVAIDSFAQLENVPQHKEKIPISFSLHFPSLYPDVSYASGSECRTSWNALTTIPCHRKVLERASRDNSSDGFGLDSIHVCSGDCTVALKQAHSDISAACSTADTFIMEGYDGFFKRTALKSGPVSAVEALVLKTDRLCRTSPTNDSDYPFCPVEMAQRFGIIDDSDVDLVGIQNFLSRTEFNRVEPEQYIKYAKGDAESKYLIREQKYGPGFGQTSCGCPDGRRFVSLPEFLSRVNRAGERCDLQQKYLEISYEATRRYRTDGFLFHRWKLSDQNGDLLYSIKHGPSFNNPLLKELRAEIKDVRDWEFQNDFNRIRSKYMRKGKWAWDNSLRTTLDTSGNCLKRILRTYEAAGCYINLSRDVLSYMIEDERNPESKELRSFYCRQRCSDWFATPPEAACTAGNMTSKAKGFFEEYLAATSTREAYCSLLGEVSEDWNCPKAILDLNRTTWALDGRPESPVFLAQVEHALNELRSKSNLDKTPASSGKNVSSIEAKVIKHTVHKDVGDLGQSICAGCIWRWLTGRNMNETMEYMRSMSSTDEYIDLVKKYHATCTSLGATWLGAVPHGNDPILWRVKDQTGNVLRYMQVLEGKHLGDIFEVDEKTKQVASYNDARYRPAIKSESLWHVLQAQRGLKALNENKFEEWEREEKEHRRVVDKTLWSIQVLGVEYIGP